MTPFDGGVSVPVVTEPTDTESTTAFLARALFAEPVPPRGDLDELRRRLTSIGAHNAPADDTTLRAVVYLLDTVISAIHVNTTKHDPKFWERVLEAHDLVHDFRGDARKRRRVLESIEWTVEHWLDPSGVDLSVSDPRTLRFGSLLTTLVYCDPRFEKLDEGFARQVLDLAHSPRTDAQQRKSGRGHIKINGAAARLAVSVGAFGDTDEGTSALAFRKASKPPSGPSDPEL
ncbi:MAG: hypothetical protein WDO74_16895 [Pseudomonadota bacterium]